MSEGRSYKLRQVMRREILSLSATSIPIGSSYFLRNNVETKTIRVHFLLRDEMWTFSILLCSPVSTLFLFTSCSVVIKHFEPIIVQVIKQYERAVIFRLGRLRPGGAKGPGLFYILPCIDTYVKIDLRTVSFDVPPQEVKDWNSVVKLEDETWTIFHFLVT